MNVSCPACETTYRIDPARVPGGHVRARCKVCSGVFEVATEAFAATSAGTAPSERTTGPQVRAEPPSAPEWRPESTPVPAPQIDAPDRPTVPRPPATPGVTGPATPAAPVAPHEPLGAPARPMAPRLSRPITPSWSIPHEPVTETPPAPAAAPEPPAAVEATPERAPPAASVTEPGAPPRPSAPVFRPNVSDAPGAPPSAPPPPPAVTPPKLEPALEAPAPPVVQPPAAVSPQPEATPAPAPEASKTRPVNPFLNRDPKAKARRLARALISDMIVYQPEKRAEAMEQGNLKEAFEEEIKKSWEEFVEQVGEDMANSTDFFNEALNEILAGGEQMF